MYMEEKRSASQPEQQADVLQTHALRQLNCFWTDQWFANLAAAAVSMHRPMYTCSVLALTMLHICPMPTLGICPTTALQVPYTIPSICTSHVSLSQDRQAAKLCYTLKKLGAAISQLCNRGTFSILHTHAYLVCLGSHVAGNVCLGSSILPVLVQLLLLTGLLLCNLLHLLLGYGALLHRRHALPVILTHPAIITHQSQTLEKSLWPLSEAMLMSKKGT